MPVMNPEVKAKWVAALRSGVYKQATAGLKSDFGHCYLGVLCEVHRLATDGPEWVEDIGGLTYMSRSGFLPENVRIWAGLDASCGARVEIGGERESLDTHNDSGKTFAQIADAIEGQL